MKKIFKKKSKLQQPRDDSSLSSSMSSLPPSNGGTPPRSTFSKHSLRDVLSAEDCLNTNIEAAAGESNKKLTRRRDLEVLGRTVGTVHEALCSMTSSSAAAAGAIVGKGDGDNDAQHSIAVTDLSFNPQGCIWNAWLYNNLQQGSDEKLAVVVTCCTHESLEHSNHSNNKNADQQLSSSYSIEVSPRDNAPEATLVEGIHLLKNQLQCVLDQVLENDSPRVCVKMNPWGGYRPKSGKSVNKESGRSVDSSNVVLTDVGAQDMSRVAQDVPESNTSKSLDAASSSSNTTTADSAPEKKTILQIAQDLSSDSSTNSNDNHEKWDAKVQERRMARQTSKAVGAVAASSDAQSARALDLQQARQEFVSSSSLSAVAHKVSSEKSYSKAIKNESSLSAVAHKSSSERSYSTTIKNELSTRTLISTEVTTSSSNSSSSVESSNSNSEEKKEDEKAVVPYVNADIHLFNNSSSSSVESSNSEGKKEEDEKKAVIPYVNADIHLFNNSSSSVESYNSNLEEKKEDKKKAGVSSANTETHSFNNNNYNSNSGSDDNSPSKHNLDLVAKGLMTEQSMKRLSAKTTEWEEDDSDTNSEYESEYDAESNVDTGNAMHAERGLMSKHSIKRLSNKSNHGNSRGHVKNMMKKIVHKVITEKETTTPPTTAVDESEIVYHEMKRTEEDAERRSTSRGILSQKSSSDDSPATSPNASFDEACSAGLSVKSATANKHAGSDETAIANSNNVHTTKPKAKPETRRLCDAEIRSARKGIFSKKSMIVVNSQLESNLDDDLDEAENETSRNDARSNFRERAMRGLLPMSSRSLLKQGNDAIELAQEVEDATDDSSSEDDAPQMNKRSSFKTRSLRGKGNEGNDLSSEVLNEDDDSTIRKSMPLPRRTSGELRSAAKGIVSRASMLEFEGKEVQPKEKRRISFDEDTMLNGWQLDHSTPDEHNVDSPDKLVFSTKELESDHKHKEEHVDILTEGQIYLGISMLVYMYSHLRETVRQGLTRVKMEDIDVHSCQSVYNARRKIKYLSKTKTAGSIIRVVIDELDGEDENDADHELLSGEGKEYEQSQTAQFRKWIEDSRVSQLDEETENMIVELRRKVARHRWKRAISAVRLSYKLSGGKAPKFEAPVAAPGCENENRFVDLNQMMSEVVRKQPKYFKEGSIMDNLIESGIEVVWFSDLTQNDVVYGVCCQREEKKVTVVFRGTVNSHNWSMNLKFDTNEYRNPIKVNYPGRADELSLHSGFALYLMRKRKDTGISKMEEIFDKVDAIGKEMAPDGSYKLSITGHSLGGALATLFGFYVAAKPRFSNLKNVYIWTYAAPRVGTQAFFHAYQYLERIGRIRHARFSNSHDIVPLIPFCNFEKDDLQFYQHVGMRIQLHNTGKIGKMRLRHALDVTYPLRHDCLSRLRRVFMNNIFANLTTIKGFGNNHTPTEIQRRLLFASHYKQALASGEHFADQKRNRIKSLDEYYFIRAQMKRPNGSDIQCDSPREASSKALLHRQKIWIIILVSVLLLSWLNYIAIILNIGSVWSVFTYALMPITASFGVALNVVKQTSYACTKYTRTLLHLFKSENHAIRSPLFVSKAILSNSQNTTSSVNKVAKLRALRFVEHTLFDAQERFTVTESVKLAIIDQSSRYLLRISSVLDDTMLLCREHSGTSWQYDMNQSLTLPSLDETLHKAEVTEEERTVLKAEVAEEEQPKSQNEKFQQALAYTVETKIQALTDKATGVLFDAKLDGEQYLVGVGVRKKSIISIYAVAMYAYPTVLKAIAVFPKRGQEKEAQIAMRDGARTFDSTSPTTTFVLHMVYKVDANTIAAAIADSVRPRYSGDADNVKRLESLISDGVKNKGGYATKGTILRFDCSAQGVSVSLDGVSRGNVMCGSIGSAFVDVFVDEQAVSPKLIESCIDTWAESGL